MILAPEDEVIADSEDDESFMPLITSSTSRSLIDVSKVGERSIDSPIQTATFTSKFKEPPTGPSAISSFSPSTHIQITRKPNPIAPSTISSFSSKPDTTSSTTSAPKSRPKPRPAYRGAQAVNTSVLDDSTSIDNGPSTFENTSMFNAADSTGLEGIFAPSLADRAKMRSRNTTVMSNNGDTTSISKSKSNPNSTAKSKRLKPNPKPKSQPVPESEVINITSSEDEMAFNPLPKSNSSSKPKLAKRTKPNISSRVPFPDSQKTITTIPILSSDAFVLPPSDPLSPLPPSPVVNGTGADVEMSPPSSIDVGRKRKRRPATQGVPGFDLGLDMDVDLDFDLHLSTDAGEKTTDGAQDSRRMSPPQGPAPVAFPAPPAPFFVGSSSSDFGITKVGDGAAGTAEAAGSVLAEKPKKKKEKERKKKKGSKGNSDPAFVESGIASGDAAADPKPKKAKDKKARSTKNAVESVVQTKGSSKSKASASAKGPFKSKEIIDDDDDDDPLGMAPLPPSVISAGHDYFPSGASFTRDSGVEDPDERGEVGGKQEEAKGKQKKNDRKGKGKEKEKSKTKKAIGLAGDQDVDNREEEEESRPVKKSAVRKVVLNDSDDEPEGAGVGVDSNPLEDSRMGKGKGVANNITEDDFEGTEVTNEQEVKENIRPPTDLSYINKPAPTSSATTSSKIPPRAYLISRTKSTPMSELIRRVNSHSGSPFHSPSPSSLSTPSLLRTKTAATVYSPLLKSSRSLLSRIAPLHPTRKPPPPPLPPIPKAKERKTKKMLEMEERWEDELSESVDGWACLEEVEREALRRRKKEMEMGGYED